ncbi:MAG: hypothetical protein M1822_004186 [Bathelium mastoideum]|nr:MAG: hypothetical protein M1822_004186 [Bathelium mastoideum]
MQASSSEWAARERNSSRSDQRSTAAHVPRTNPNASGSFGIPRLMEPEPSRAVWERSQQTSPLSPQPVSDSLAMRRQTQPGGYAVQTQRLPGVEAVLKSEIQFPPPSQRSPQVPHYLPSFSQFNRGTQPRESSVTAPDYRGETIKYGANRSLPPSPLSDRQQTFSQPRQYVPEQDERRSGSVPVSLVHRPGPSTGTTIRPGSEQPSTARSSQDYEQKPACIGQREIEGEGTCWVFADGSYYRTVVDGEPVNPDWGLTKAGKARKRLAQACLTCREKKIKCEPGFPKCTQCEKSGKTCRRASSGSPFLVSSSDKLSSIHSILQKGSSATSSPTSAGSRHTLAHTRFHMRKHHKQM